MRCLATLGLALSLLLSGCTADFVERRTTPVVGQVPEFDVPPRPVLEKLTPEELANYLALVPAVRAKLESNDKRLKAYAEQMEAEIGMYNVYARAHNKQSNKWIGIPDTMPSGNWSKQ